MNKTAVYDLPELFETVQLSHLFEDSKTFVDCVPNYSLEDIEKKYLAEKGAPGFDPKSFVLTNFIVPAVSVGHYESDRHKPVEENIRLLWDTLTREPSNEQSSLLNLPYTYVVPGGRFREIYYWDSYFTMLGLKEHKRADLVESMIENFAFLIRTYGHIPNGNRQYYLSRSQPPFFALMVSLLAEMKGDDVFKKYLNELIKEHEFWQTGIEEIHPGAASNRVVQMPGGEILNRYFDNNTTPRQESYSHDVYLSRTSKQPPESLFVNLRAGAESGWDFSSRWFEDEKSFETIHTTDIVPVDLNCLLYTLEKTIAKAQRLTGDERAALSYEQKAEHRRNAILKYCWNKEAQFFCDYDFKKDQPLGNITAAGLFPLFVSIATTSQALMVSEKTTGLLLKGGGIVTTTINSGQQWDAPNGWAPLQWVAYVGLVNYGHYTLANEIAQRWLALNDKVFAETGKLMEKYNVEDLDQPAGGGEYEGQDGFGWTNGIYIALKNSLQSHLGNS